jgi:hypothetical protein
MKLQEVGKLEGSMLDAVVAKAEGLQCVEHPAGCAVMSEFISIGGGAYVLWSPSTDWSVGGPIIERERICIAINEEDYSTPSEPWYAECGVFWDIGRTPLIAAMRAYVADKFCQ